jgi:hypothetical protein
MLAQGPPRIAAASAGIPPAELRLSVETGAWSVNEVLAHLRACCDVWAGCIERIVVEERPTIRAMNPRTWIEKTDYLEQDFQRSLEAFTAQREALVELLSGLPGEAWSRAATVTGAGKMLERTVFAYAEWMATHERSHLKQIERMLAKPRL